MIRVPPAAAPGTQAAERARQVKVYPAGLPMELQAKVYPAGLPVDLQAKAYPAE